MDFRKYADNFRDQRTRLTKLNLPTDNRWMNSIGQFIQHTSAEMGQQLVNIDANDPLGTMIQQPNIENREATTTDLSAKLFVCCNLMLIGVDRMLANGKTGRQDYPRLHFIQSFDITGDGHEGFDVPTTERYLDLAQRNAGYATSLARMCIAANESAHKRLEHLTTAFNKKNTGEHSGEQSGAESKMPTIYDAFDDIPGDMWQNIMANHTAIVHCMNAVVGIIGHAKAEEAFCDRCNHWCGEIEGIAQKYPKGENVAQPIGERSTMQVDESRGMGETAAGTAVGGANVGKGRRTKVGAGAEEPTALAAAE